MVNPFQRLKKWIQKVMQSRKRKQQEMETAGSTSSLGDEGPDIGGDGYPLPKKCNRSGSNEFFPCPTGLGDNEHPHQVWATLGPVICNEKGVFVQLDSYKTNASNEKVQFRTDCPYGDYCADHLGTCLPLTNERQIDTGSQAINNIVKDMTSRGFQALHVFKKGRFGAVVLTYSHPDSRNIVFKFRLNKSDRSSTSKDELACSWDEASILKNLHHCNIVELLQFQQYLGYDIIHMEHCENGCLKELLSKHPGQVISEVSARKYTLGLIDGLEYVHSQCVVHLDIRPENLLINSYDQLKISDFGDAAFFKIGDPLFNKSVGILGYKAPEVIECSSAPYNPRFVDIWAAGCVLYRMVFGSTPFNTAPTEPAALELMKKGIKDVLEKHQIHTTKQLKKLLTKMLKFLPETRCTLKTIQTDEWTVVSNHKAHISGVYLMGNLQKCFPGQEELYDKTKQCI